MLQLKEKTVGRPARWSGAPEPLVGPAERSFSDLLELKAEEREDEPFLRFYERTLSLREINQRSNRVAHRLISYGAGPGQAAAVMMGNSPEWLIVFYALQKLGMCAVPVAIDLRGEELASILRDTESRFLFIDHDLLGEFESVRTKLDKVDRVAVYRESDDPRFRLPPWAELLDVYLDEALPDADLNLDFDRNNACMIIYTSGTTGPPKGVVCTYARSGVTLLGVAAHVFYEKDDVLYTCLPLYHPNALLFTVTEAMWRDLRVGLGRSFYPSSFWGEIRMYRATTFSCLGSMTSILMKQPRKPNDPENPVRVVFTSGCPASIWREFEERFDVKIYEGYDAVDNGGFVSFNMGNAPLGSIGKPAVGRFRIVDEKGEEVPQGEAGELVSWVGKKKGVLTYLGNKKAAEDRVRDGWLHTGDLAYKDENGFLYYAGRLTDLARRRGEKISTYRVGREIEKHPEVLECAAYPIRASSGEDEIMVSVVPLEGSKLDASALHGWMEENLAPNAVPRYVDFVEQLPKTGTHWIKKRELVRKGVTGSTADFGNRR
jgi:crotonobetaine/carnitine-CoA ligase